MESYLSTKDIAHLEQAASSVRDKLLIRLLYRLACRISEALALKVEDLDLGTGLATIIHLKSRVRLFCPSCGTRLGRAHCFCPGCGNKVDEATKKELEHRRLRTLPIDAETVRMLTDYIKRGGPVTRDGVKLIFGINRHRAWQIIRDCAERADLSPLLNPETGEVRGVSPHRLRDAFAIRAMKMDDSGDGLRLLQEHLGHASFNTTAKYRKVAGQEHREWYDKLWKRDSEDVTS
ncbi:MAG: integrase [Chloroflexi bacterium]|nr:integrase [Chloroflexota bacterium]